MGFYFFHALHSMTRTIYRSCQFLWEVEDISQSREPAVELGQVISDPLAVKSGLGCSNFGLIF